MFSSIFRKQLFTYLTTIAVVFFAFAVAMSQVLNGYFIEKEEQMLIDQAEKVSQLYTEAHIRFLTIGDSSLASVKKELDWMESALNINYFLLDEQFRTIGATHYEDSENVNSMHGITIPEKQLRALMEGRTISLTGNLGGMYKGEFITIGRPIMYQTTMIATILMSSSLPNIEQKVSEVLNQTFTLLAFTAMISFVLIYVTSKTISKPILEINEAAKIISSGNFEKRIVVISSDEVGQLADSFNTMAESLNKQEIQRRNFIANISHDIRSPLTTINGFLQAIMDGTIPKENQEKYFKIIIDETTRLGKLANDMLDVNKLGEVEITKTVFDLNELIRKTVIQFESRILEKEINFDISFSDDFNLVTADEEKIQRVVYNIMDNAIKFTNNNGNITVKNYTEGEKIFTSIKDDGVGISLKEQKHVFDRFYKVDTSRGKDRKGSGLGLSIIKEFMKMHGEDVVLKSDIGKGCEFVFSLTLNEKK